MFVNSPTKLSLRCLQCSGELCEEAETIVCRRCGETWPFKDGIPRFFRHGYYYWEGVDRRKAKELLESARRGSWVEAVRKHFSDREMSISILDLQQAAWLPLLGLPGEAIALDIGSGYGAITHSLACSLSEVYSVEPIPERIEFTQARLRQEGLSNVRLIQASAIELPFFEESFDLVVANGVLEWVGEWDLERNPRVAQLRFLTAARRLLKKHGVMVISIENRFGYGYFLGQVDHSGIPYTSLVPRRLATFLLRRHQPAHYRTVLNSRREYRTYTYSVRGYRKLLREAGFADVTHYWADPGYNQPYALIPLSAPRLIREHFLDQLDHPGAAGQMTWRRGVKRAAARFGFPGWLLPDFVIIASRDPSRSTEMQEWVREQLRSEFGAGANQARSSEGIVLSCHTAAFSSKHTLRFSQPRWVRGRIFLKARVRMSPCFKDQPPVLANAGLVRDHLAAVARAPIRLPKPVGSLRSGNTFYYLETSASGIQFSRTVRQPGYFNDLRRVEKDFGRVIKAGSELAVILQEIKGANPINPAWYEIPEDFKSLPELCRRLEALRYYSISPTTSRPLWVQHGDFTVENVFLDPLPRAIEVIDWEHLASGYPPLYDLFQLICSSAYLDPSRNKECLQTEEDFYVASFSDLFFSRTDVGRVIGDLVVEACQRLAVSPDLLPNLLLEFLLIRLYHYRALSMMAGRTHLALLSIYLEREERQLFGQLPVRPREPIARNRLGDARTKG